MKPPGTAAEARRARALPIPTEPDGRDEYDEDHRRAFGEHTGLCLQRRAEIDQLRRGYPRLTRFGLIQGDVRRISGLGWELLGRYIARSDSLVHVEVDGARFMDEEMSRLFEHWTGTSSVTSLAFARNQFGAEGIESMAPLLQNAPLAVLNISRNDRFDLSALRSLVRALDGGPLKYMSVQGCNLVDVAALQDHDLSCLQTLNLAHNNLRTIPSLDTYTGLQNLVLRDNDIGKEGSLAIANLLRNGSPALSRLDISFNLIDDEGAEVIAGSLERNATLRELRLDNNLLEENGMRALLRLLNDVSSIARTYRSNHALLDVGLLPQRIAATSKAEEMAEKIAASLKFNGRRASGRSKVVATQLDGENRRRLCRLQGVAYAYGRIFAEVDPIVLPELLALAGLGPSGRRTRVYRILVAAAPGLASLRRRERVEDRNYGNHGEWHSGARGPGGRARQQSGTFDSGGLFKSSGGVDC